MKNSWNLNFIGIAFVIVSSVSCRGTSSEASLVGHWVHQVGPENEGRWTLAFSKEGTYEGKAHYYFPSNGVTEDLEEHGQYVFTDGKLTFKPSYRKRVSSKDGKTKEHDGTLEPESYTDIKLTPNTFELAGTQIVQFQRASE